MKKLRLIAVRSRQEEILRELMLLGCVEISEPAEEPAEELLRSLRRSDSGRAGHTRADQQTLLNALKQLDRYAPEKKGLLTPLREVSLEELLDESVLEKDLETAQRILALDGRVRSLTSQESRERATVEAMQPWVSMDQPLEKRGTQTCELLFGTLPAAAPVAECISALGELEAELTEISEDKTSRYIAVVFRRGGQEKILAELRKNGFAQVSLSGLTGTPREIIARAEENLKRLAEEKADTVAALEKEASHREELQLGADTMNTIIAREENGSRLLNTDSTFYFEGWLTAPEEKKLEEALSRFPCAWETEEPDPEHPEEVPVKLKNNAFTSPFNMVTEMYSLPAYNGLDPNPFIAPFFALFFGIMFADMAYGILLMVAGALFLWKARPRGTMKHMAGLLLICGVSTTIIGFLSGGFFGDAVKVVGGMFGRDWTLIPHLGTIHIGSTAVELPLDLLQGNNPLYMLIFAIALGAVHLAVGVGIGVYLKVKDGQWLDAILNDVSWWVILAGLGLMVLKKGTVVLWIGVGMMVLGAVLSGKGFGRITGIFSAVYNGATGYLGDFLSYSRLMALMLAGSVIASVFNQLGALGGGTVGGVVLFLAVFLIGHGLNFALNLIGCFVHTLRLQFLEFFGKWYRDGGRAFRPLRVDTRFVDVTEERS